MNYIINLHGYNGNKNNNIFKILKNMKFNYDVKIISIQLSNKPKEDFKMLVNFVKRLDSSVIIVSKNLSSFYACLLNSMFKIPCICFNPSFDPLKNIVFKDENDIEFIKEKDFKNFDFDQDIACFMSTNDNRIDHLEHIKKYPFLKYTENIIVDDHDHDFTKLESDKETVNLFKNLIEYYFLKLSKLI